MALVQAPKKELKASLSLVESDLKQVDSVILELTGQRAGLIPVLSTHLVSSGGKRLRPVLTLLSARLCGYSGMRHVYLAAAVEFIHTATLLHDDVVDESALRRGLPTANNLWGNKASILVGDFLLSQAFQLMVRDGSLKTLDILSSAAAVIAEGEVMQLMSSQDIHLSEETYTRIIAAKTAELFAAAAEIGAVVADKGEEEALALRHFGRDLGIAFQIVDDTLDYSAEQKQLGKTVGDDFREGKVTLPVIYAYMAATFEEKSFLEQVFNQEQREAEDFSKTLSLIKKYNALERSMERACYYADAAYRQLAHFPDNAAREVLSDIVEFSVERAF